MRTGDGARTSPGQRALRRGRRSLPGWTYLLTLCTEGRQPVLTAPGVPEILLASLRWVEQKGWAHVDGYAIMPDHLHLVLKLHEAVPLSELVESFRKFTARRANRVLQRAGALWQRAFYDHAIRDQMDYETRMRYMWENPVRAGLAQRAEEYAWCSVHGLPDAPLPAGEQ